MTPYTSYRWITFCESVTGHDTPLYLVVTHQGETIGRATWWLTYQEPLPVANRWMRRGLQTVFRRWPLLICRVPVANRPGLALSVPDQREPALIALAKTAHEYASQHHAFATLFDYLDEESTAGLAWPDGFQTITMSEPGTWMPLVWPNFESYLRSLDRSARKDYHRHTNRAADLEIEVHAHSRVTTIDNPLRLIRSVEVHHRTAPNPYARAILQHIEQVDGIWLTAEQHGQLVGCGLLLPDRGAVTLALLGLDYRVKYVYFQLLYTAIRCAIEMGAAMLRAGSGAYAVKQRLGFQIERPTAVAYRLTNRWLHQLANWMVAVRRLEQS